MTVQVTDRLSQLYVGNGVNTRFDFTFRVFDQEDETGVAVRVKVENDFEFLDESKYAVTINQDELGGYVTFVEAPDAQTFFYIAGKTPVDQLLDITNYDNFYPDAIERALDKLTAILQEWKHLVDFETQARILADIDYDQLAIQREADLKAYIDGIASAITGQPVTGLPSKFVVDGVDTQDKINDRTIQKISKISDLRTLVPRVNTQIVNVVQHTEENLGGGLFKYNQLRVSEDDNATIVKGWEKLNLKNLTVFDFGALDSQSNSTLFFEGADTYAKTKGIKIEIPTGTTFNVDNANFNTQNFFGGGKLKHISSSYITLPEQRRGSYFYNDAQITLEDVFDDHLTKDGESERYTAFGGAATLFGKEFIAVRTGKDHFRDAITPSSLVLYIIDRTKASNPISKSVLFTPVTGKDVRDVNVCIHPSFGNRLLIKYVIYDGINYEGWLITYNATNYTVESNRKLDFGVSQFVWGNTLISPSGRLITASYGLNGSINIYRSTSNFDVLATTTISLALIKTFEPSAAAEPTICYFDDRMVIFYRMGTGVQGKFAWTYDKEGLVNWSTPTNMGREVHAPAVEPYLNTKEELFMISSLGPARAVLSTFATQNLTAWYSTANILVANDQIGFGGYPSIVDYGDEISVSSFVDIHNASTQPCTIFDVRKFKKRPYSALNAINAQRETFRNSNLAWGEYSLNASATNIDVKIALKVGLTFSRVRMRMTGVSTSTFAELLNEAGAIVATSANISINTSSSVDVDFIFSSAALTAGIYTIRIQRRDSANPYVFNWNTQNYGKPRIIKNRVVDILGLTSSDSSSLWNNAGIHVDLF